MDQAPPDSKRPRLAIGSSWSAGAHLLHPTPSPTHSQHSSSHAQQLQQQQQQPLPHHTAAPPPGHPAGLGQYPPPPSHNYSPHSHPYSRPPPEQHHPAHMLAPPPPPPPHSHTPQPPQQGPRPPPVPAITQIDERRHHELDRYPPMQEHRHPIPSPVLPPPPPPYHGYTPGPREPMVKPDPGGPGGEESTNNLPQLRRPHSTGNNHPEGLAGPGPAHTSLPPQQPPPDDRRHMSFDSGPQPPLYRQQSYAPPPTPVSHGTPYDYGPSSYGPTHADLPYGIPMTITGKRKAQRASQACDSCRQLKAKCDELKPCKSCKEKKLECKYRDPAPKAQDKVTTDILEAILTLQDNVVGRLTRMERAMVKSGIKLELGDEDDGRPTSVGSGYKYSSSPENPTTGGETGEAEAQRMEMSYQDRHAQQAQQAQDQTALQELVRDQEMEEDQPPGPPVAPGAPSIPLNHTTVASMLLQWKPIKQLVQHHLEKEKIKYEDEFPIQQETRRGLLRLFGRGEGSDNRWPDREANLEQGISTDAYDNYAYSDAGVSSPADCWGTVGGQSPSSTVTSKDSPNSPLLDFSEDKVWMYVRSYEDNIQNIHPLITPKELHALVTLFLNSVEQSKVRYRSEVAGWSTSMDTGSKRKRSPAMDGPDTPKLGKPVIQRSIQSALVLLVLALGKISLHKTRIPDPVSTSNDREPPATNHGSPMMGHPRNGYPPQSPMQGSPPAMPNSYSSGYASPIDSHHSTGSRRASFQGGASGLPRPIRHHRNMEVIPGLDYFATATDILGNQFAGCTMKHVYANILAGLYYGQLGRVMESYAHIKHACYCLLLIMRPSLHRIAKLQETKPFHPEAVTSVRDNQMVFAFWSCLQLESDIIAELPLPQSQILQYEEKMPYPNVELAKQSGFKHIVMVSYTTQLYLRRSLNEVHQLLYDPKRSQEGQGSLPRPDPKSTVYQYLMDKLAPTFIPKEFKFDPSDPPAPDILAARLRAKYWGAHVIILRPFIRQIVQFNFQRTTLASPVPIAGDFRTGLAVPVIGPQAETENDINPEIIEHAQKGILALIESTKSFHGLKDERFIITNVFGTAHAQWGNLLVLSAAYKDPTLNKFIAEHTLKELFTKTIKFFRTVAHHSSALAIDMRILEGLNRELFNSRNNSDMAAPNTSFSRTGSGGPPTLAPLAPSMTPPNTMHLPPISMSMDTFRPPPRHT